MIFRHIPHFVLWHGSNLTSSDQLHDGSKEKEESRHLTSCQSIELSADSNQRIGWYNILKWKRELLCNVFPIIRVIFYATYLLPHYTVAQANALIHSQKEPQVNARILITAHLFLNRSFPLVESQSILLTK